MKKISNKVTQVRPSKTLEIDAKAKVMEAAGFKVYNFSAGEPDLAPPELIRESLNKAFTLGKTKYGATCGELSLREEICQKLKKGNKLSYKPENIAVTNGCKQALYNIFQCILNPGEEVVVYSPYWVSYLAQIKLADGRPRIVKTDKNFEPDLEKTQKAINSKTKAVIVNSPNNPTGVVYSKNKLQVLAKLFEDKNIYVITDDVYEKLIFNGKFYTIAQFMKKKKDKVIIVNGISKSYALTGLRVGYIAANRDIISLVNNLQSHESGNVCSVAQVVAEDVLRKGDSFVRNMAMTFKKRKDLVENILNKNNKINFKKPDGAFYYFINIFGIDKDSDKFCKRLLQEKKVAIVPGAAFGMEGYVRISFANNEKDLKKGLKKFNEFCEKY
jgi:aspartate aminotransferase